MLNETKDTSNSNFNHEAQVELLYIALIFELEIGKFMHKFYNNQLPETFKNILRTLNINTTIQLMGADKLSYKIKVKGQKFVQRYINNKQKLIGSNS